MGLVSLSRGKCSHQVLVSCHDLAQIPLYALFKLWSNFVGPMLRQPSASSPTDGGEEPKTLSKRQEKLRKRSERGDPRVRTTRR